MLCNIENSYLTLPGIFFAKCRSTPVCAPQMVLWNESLAQELGLEEQGLKGMDGSKRAELFSGNQLPPGIETIAQAYAGHQFGHFTILGDGRALLLGEHQARDGRRVDLQFKGSGRTPFSRGGDGRAALGPMIREFLISEAMHALNIPSTRSLAVVATGEWVDRPGMTPERSPGAILTRVAASHLRVGTFEFAASRGRPEDLRALTDYSIARHFPECLATENPYLGFLEKVIARQAALVSKWLLVGFIHGVMNTDNMAISGETIDYGPCAFMDRFDPLTVFSSIDRNARYAYGRQPGITQWNLARLAEALLPLLDPNGERAVELAQKALENFSVLFGAHWLSGMRHKLGFASEEAEDEKLVETWLDLLRRHQADFTNSFRALSGVVPFAEEISRDPLFLEWKKRWQDRLTREGSSTESAGQRMRQANPALIPRNHLVEGAIAAALQGDLSPVRRLSKALAMPFQELPEFEDFRRTPERDEEYRTFCGT